MIVPSSVTTPRGDGAQFTSSYLINGVVCIDAGAIGLSADIDAQARIEAVFLSHSHLDHVGSLPMFLDNVYRLAPRPPMVYAGPETIEALESNVFTRETWMSLDVMRSIDPPFVKIEVLGPGKTVETAGLRVTPIPVHHVIPTFGFLIEEPGCAVLFSGDTGPTEEFWEVANRTESLRAIFIEASFPSAMESVAHASGHLTPALLAAELRKLRRDVPIIAVHLKPRHAPIVSAELRALGHPALQIAVPGKHFTF
jgi:ribonuclease BN (tRNA processing enzyme)